MAKKAMSELAKEEQKLAIKLLIPTFIILLVIALYPLGQVFYTSFTNRTFAGTGTTEFVGLDNYQKLLAFSIEELPPVVDEETGKVKIDEETGEKVFQSPIQVLPRQPELHRPVYTFNFFGSKYVVGAVTPDFIRAVFNTIIFTVFSVLIETILGLGVALVVNSEFKGRGMMRAVMLVPWAVITVVSAKMWQWMFQPTRAGLFNMLLDKFGIGTGNFSFLTNPSLQMPAIIAVDVWKTTPFMALLLLAGLQLIPQELYEAAEVDGASKIRQFFTITLPLLKPSVAVALIFRTLDSLRVFDVFQVLLAQKRYSMASFNYFQLISARQMGMASAIGVIIFILIFFFALAYMKALGVDTE
ncbi:MULTISPECIES: carbohydrate ABC transporter permease [Halanaerobium]|jgi:trehalose/maltose transport system permease protein|uniref:Trehalose/maltose transport system permease protein n=1 Tax=Halanaerobium saccharolyticum TaxID=43595 RepID=A0A4R6SEE9_9FIRM|nr:MULTISPECIES: sugar ABC transporter permease [Halanaerobium]PUU89888.1 MAG: multiple sugar transport system permease protein [Halanaerobium sp.]PUU90109.1 MAG: multiple sugar transport system permease protein [Halanaerobium sp.]TDQ00004.1 trehalose/maltose transport system permease protein [Halanaerobium saccharolyticum]